MNIVPCFSRRSPNRGYLNSLSPGAQLICNSVGCRVHIQSFLILACPCPGSAAPRAIPTECHIHLRLRRGCATAIFRTNDGQVCRKSFYLGLQPSPGRGLLNTCSAPEIAAREQALRIHFTLKATRQPKSRQDECPRIQSRQQFVESRNRLL
jgi:hypothetical protein